MDFTVFDQRTGAERLSPAFIIECSADGGVNFDSKEFKSLWRTAKALRGRLTHVLWTDVDRYARDGAEGMNWFKKFKEIGVEVNFTNHWYDFTIPESLIQFYTRLGSAEAEIRKLSMRTCDGKERLRSYGFYNDSLPRCWKYEDHRRPDGRKYANKVEPFFTAFKIAAEEFYKGSTQASAIRTAKRTTGYEIPSSTLSRFLVLPVAYGYVPVYNKYNIPISQRVMVDMIPCENIPPMFPDLNMFYSVRNRIIKAGRSGLGINRESFNPEFPLRVSCPICYSKMRGYNSNPKRPTPTPYYDCKSCGRETRVNRNKLYVMIAEMLNSISIESSVSALLDKGADQALSGLKNSESKRKEGLTKALINAKHRLEYLDDNMHRYPPEVYSRSFNKITIQITQIESDLQLIESERAAGLDVRGKILSSLVSIGDWYLKATPQGKARLMGAFFPLGFVASKKGFRTWQLNRVLGSMCSFPDRYIIKKGETGADHLISPLADENGQRIEQYRVHIVLLQEFFSNFKKVA